VPAGLSGAGAGGLIFAYLGPLLHRCCRASTSSPGTMPGATSGKVVLPATGCSAWRTSPISTTSTISTACTTTMCSLSRVGSRVSKEDRVYNGVKQVEMGFEVFKLGSRKRRRLGGDVGQP